MLSQDKDLYTTREDEPKWINDKGYPVNLYFDPRGRRVIRRKSDYGVYMYVLVEDRNKRRIPTEYIKTNKTCAHRIMYTSYDGDYYNLLHGYTYKFIPQKDYRFLTYQDYTNEPDNLYAWNEMKIVVRRLTKEPNLKVVYKYNNGQGGITDIMIDKIVLSKTIKQNKETKGVTIHFNDGVKTKKVFYTMDEINTTTFIIQDNKMKIIYIYEVESAKKPAPTQLTMKQIDQAITQMYDT